MKKGGRVYKEEDGGRGEEKRGRGTKKRWRKKKKRTRRKSRVSVCKLKRPSPMNDTKLSQEYGLSCH